MTAGTNSSRLAHPAYRKDIDGLRAVAVLSVVGFHAFPHLITGGFIGVDIFFVISGYLISSIIFGNLERDSFSLAEFYRRRVRRIFPALITVVLTGLVIGWYVLLAGEYKQLGIHVAGSAAFVENFVLWHENGYFDNAAETKPLLHLWSLAIEEQFYIFWPLLLAFVWRRNWSFLFITAAIATVSFTVNICLAGSHAIADFYSPASRFWELMVGGLLAYVTLHRPEILSKHKNLQSTAGLALILAGLMLVNKDSAFPGWWAALPVLGAAFIIAAGESSMLNRLLLSNRFMVGVGLVSFPLYLWHWPLLSFLRIIQSGSSTPATCAAAVLLALVLAWVTYRFVEAPFRHGAYGSAKVAVLLALMVVLGFGGYTIAGLQGMEQRYIVQHSVSNSWLLGGAPVKPCTFLSTYEASQLNCMQDARELPRYALIGDSKAGALTPGLFSTSRPGGRWIFYGSGGAGPLLPVISNDPLYAFYPKTSVDIALKHVIASQSVTHVLIATATRALFQLKSEDSIDSLPLSKNYEPAFAGLLGTVQRLVDAKKKVILLVDNPTLPRPEDCLQRNTSIAFVNRYVTKTHPNCQLGMDRYLQQRENYIRVLTSIRDRYPHDVSIFDATDILCDVHTRVCPSARNGHTLYGRTDHISDFSSGLIGEALNDALAAQ